MWLVTLIILIVKRGFLNRGKVIHKCRGDLYLIRNEDWRILKKRHCGLKKVLKITVKNNFASKF
jgi:hypothetical protein